jgi:hypothetical protein
MNLTLAQNAISAANSMLSARAAAQIILKDKYLSVVGGFKAEILEKVRKTGKSPLEIMEPIAADMTDEMLLIYLLSGCLEAIEEISNSVYNKYTKED